MRYFIQWVPSTQGQLQGLWNLRSIHPFYQNPVVHRPSNSEILQTQTPLEPVHVNLEPQGICQTVIFFHVLWVILMSGRLRTLALNDTHGRRTTRQRALQAWGHMAWLQCSAVSVQRSAPDTEGDRTTQLSRFHSKDRQHQKQWAPA